MLGAGLIGALAVLQAASSAVAGSVLFRDDFESDAVGAPAAGWHVTSGTWLVAVDGTNVLKETDTNTATPKSISAGSTAWGDYSVQAQVKPGSIATGTSNVLSGRYTDDNNSYALILKDGNAWYFGKKVNGGWTTFANGALAYGTTVWYQLELDLVGSQLSAFINGTKMATVKDSTFSSGAIAVMSRTLMEVDNVTVTALTLPPPSPSPSPPPSA